MLTDEEADRIRAGVESGLRGPVVIKWIRELLDDRDAAGDQFDGGWVGLLRILRTVSAISLTLTGFNSVP